MAPTPAIEGPDDAIDAVITAPPGHRWCKNCKAWRLPDPDPDRGQRCDKCKCAMKGSKINQTQPVDPQARAEHLKRLIAEYQPATMLLQRKCNDLAAIYERLDKIKPGGAEHQRLLLLAENLERTLEASRSPRASHDRDVDAMTVSELIAETSTTLRGLLELQDAEARAKAGLSGQGGTKPGPENAVPTAVPPASEAGTSPASGRQPRPEPDCPFGCGTMTRCADLKEKNLEVWRVLHWLDDSERERRRQEEFKEMLESMKRARRGDPWITW